MLENIERFSEMLKINKFIANNSVYCFWHLAFLIFQHFNYYCNLFICFQNAYVEYKEIKAAQGVKIAAKELEKAIAGLNLFVAHKLDEVDIVKEEVAKELKSALSNIKLQERGVYVQASTLGSLEALLEFLRTSKIPVSANLSLFYRPVAIPLFQIRLSSE